MTPFSTRCILPNDWTHLKHFTPPEFSHPQFMGYEFMLWLEDLRARINIPLTITSSYRSANYNAQVGGAKDSAHVDIPCNAVDIGERPRPDDSNWNHSRWLIIKEALNMNCVRIGTYANGSLHLDRSEYRRPGEVIWRVVGSLHSL